MSAFDEFLLTITVGALAFGLAYLWFRGRP